MTRERPDPPARPAPRSAREERLAAALKSNLARRKAQSRGRAEAETSEPRARDDTNDVGET